MEYSNYTHVDIISEISEMIKAEIDQIQSNFLVASNNTTKKIAIEAIEIYSSNKSWKEIGTLENCSLEDAEKFVKQIKKLYPSFTADALFRVVG